jgi:hypothetical protein
MGCYPKLSWKCWVFTSSVVIPVLVVGILIGVYWPQGESSNAILVIREWS